MIPLRDAAHTLFKTVIKAGDPVFCIKKNLSVHENELILKKPEMRINLSAYNRLIVIGAGKAAAHMAGALEALFTQVSLPVTGIVSTKQGHGIPLQHIDVIEASHPIPDNEGVKAAEQIIRLLDQAGEKDLVISLFSGGGSALLTLPVPGITLEEKQIITDLLLRSGAEIDEINTVRKHISRVKGGRLMHHAYPAKVLNLLLSDVLENKVDVIASGPFVPDESTFIQAVSVCEKYRIFNRIPGSIQRYLSEGAKGEQQETPTKKDPCFSHLITAIIGSNQDALEAGKQKADTLGFHTLILSTRIKGEARELGKILAGIARQVADTGDPVPPPACILAGGETTVTVTGQGKGGRNQECALAAVKEIEGLPGTLVFCAGTDGTDGPTDAAGAWCTGETFCRAVEKGLDPVDYLLDNDSYHFFEKIGNLIKTGPTGTNVMDVYLLLVGKNP